MGKTLPHRIAVGRRAGHCRDCGQIELESAPDTCARCALQRMAELGHPALMNPERRFADGDERWREVVHACRSGAVASDRFYLYVGHADGAALEPPVREVVGQMCWRVGSRAAQLAAVELTRRYAEVWVVTTVGCWSAWPAQVRTERSW